MTTATATATTTTTPHNHDWYKRGKIIVLHIQHGQLYILFFAFLCYFSISKLNAYFFTPLFGQNYSVPRPLPNWYPPHKSKNKSQAKREMFLVRSFENIMHIVLRVKTNQSMMICRKFSTLRLIYIAVLSKIRKLSSTALGYVSSLTRSANAYHSEPQVSNSAF